MPATLLLLLLFICWTSAHNLASVMVTPGNSQHFEYEYVSVSCAGFGPGKWTVWRYTTDGVSDLKLSQCGSGWGIQSSTSCNMTSGKNSDSGVYWCQSEYRDSSNVVNITFTTKDVILESPALPVMYRQNVTLHCRSSLQAPAAFYKGGSLIKTESTGHMTIHHFSKSDEGAYKCKIDGNGESSPSWLLMKDDSPPVSLTVFPDSTQHFEYSNLTLTCGGGTLHGWIIKRSTTSGNISICGDESGKPRLFSCNILTAKLEVITGVYWCESPTRQRSNSINITIHGGSVILQSPALPVLERGNVTLRCIDKLSSNLPAAFYKDGSLIRTEPTGHMIIHHVTKSDEGLYKCNISSRGESPSSWLFVRVNASTEPNMSDLRTIRYIVVCSPYLISTILLLSIYRQRPTGYVVRGAGTVPPPNLDVEEIEPQYEDVIADVTTEHHF